MIVTPSPAHAGPSLVSRIDSIPVGGIGLALSDPTSGGYTVDDLRRALARCASRPKDCGIDFRFPADCGHINYLDDAVRRFLEGRLLGAPDPRHPAFRTLVDIGPFGSAVPLMMVVGADQILVVEEHLALYLDGIARGTINRGRLPPLVEWDVYKIDPVAYQRPKARGPVTPGHVEAFTVMLPELSAPLTDIIPWVNEGGPRLARAEIANGVASRALGISVDLRVGGLVTALGIRRAIGRAAGEAVHRDGRRQLDRLAPFVSAKVPTVRPEATSLRVNGLAGAAWSCVVDTVLNQREAWAATRTPCGSLIWASDKYVPATERGDLSWASEISGSSIIH